MSTTTADNPRLKRLSLLTATPFRASSGKEMLSQPPSPRRAALMSRQDVFNSTSMNMSSSGDGASDVKDTTEHSKLDSLLSRVDENITSHPQPRGRQPRPLSLLVSSPSTCLSPSRRASLSIQQTPRSIQRHFDSTPPLGRGRERLVSPILVVGGNGNRERALRPMSLRLRPSGEWNNPTRNLEDRAGEDIPQASEAKNAKGGLEGAMTLMEKYASLLTLIAQKESTVQETRQELHKQEEELAVLKSEWQTIITQSHLSPTVRQTSTPSTTLRKQPPKPSFRSATCSALNTQEENMNVIDGGLMGGTKAGTAMEEGKKMFGQFMDSLVGIQEGTTSSTNHRNVEDAALEHRSDCPGNPVISLDSPISLETRSDPPSAAASERQIESLFSSLVTSTGTESSWAETAASWGDVVGLGSPTIQEGSKRATAFLSVNLTETLNALAKVLPTPNLATLTAPQPPDGRERTTSADSRCSTSPTPSQGKRQAGTRRSSGKEKIIETPREPRPEGSSRPRSFLDDDLEETSGLPNVLTPFKAGTSISSRSSDRSDDKDLAEWNW